MSLDADVIIVGAGLAGLTAAYYINKKDPSLAVKILEADDRIGGRLLTVPLLVKDGSSVSFFDVNGSWVCKHQKHFWDLLEKLDVPVTGYRNSKKIIVELDRRYEAESKRGILKFLSLSEQIQFMKFILQEDGEDRPYSFGEGSSLKKIQQIIDENGVPGWSHTQVESICYSLKAKGEVKWLKELSQSSLKRFINKNVNSKTVRAVIEYMVLLNSGCRSSDMSALFFIFFCISTRGLANQLITEESNIRQFKIRSSAHNICWKIAEDIGRKNIFTGERVLQVMTRPYRLEVVTNRRVFRGNYLLKQDLAQEWEEEEKKKDCVRNTLILMSAVSWQGCKSKVQISLKRADWSATDITVSCTNVILAVAPGNMSEIEFFPPLPTEKIDSIEKTCSNIVTSFLATYPREFWTDRGFSGEIYVFDKKFTDGPIDYCENVSHKKKAALQGRIFSRRMPCDSYKRQVLDQLSEYFGAEALFPTDYYEKSWHENSCQMICWQQENANYFEKILKPFNRIHFAGAETSMYWYGYLAGAVHSGIRAAIEVIYDIRPGILTQDDWSFLQPTSRSLINSLRRYDNWLNRFLVDWKYNTFVIAILLVILWKLRRLYL